LALPDIGHRPRSAQHDDIVFIVTRMPDEDAAIRLAAATDRLAYQVDDPLHRKATPGDPMFNLLAWGVPRAKGL